MKEKAECKVFEALDRFFEVILGGLRELVDGERYFDTFADDAIFESRRSRQNSRVRRSDARCSDLGFDERVGDLA